MSDYEDTFDLGRLRKLAGMGGASDDLALPAIDEPTISMDAPLGGPVVDPMIDDHSVDTIDMDAGLDIDMDHSSDVIDADIDLPTDTVPPITPAFDSVGADDGRSHWEQTLAQLEDQLNDIPVGDFKAVIDSLHRVAHVAENIRLALITEGKRTFLDYLREAEQGDTTLGNNQNDAIKALHARMGGKPQDAQAARKKFDDLRKSGVIKPKGSSFTMPTMDDDTFNATIAGDGTGPKVI